MKFSSFHKISITIVPPSKETLEDRLEAMVVRAHNCQCLARNEPLKHAPVLRHHSSTCPSYPPPETTER